VPPCLFKGSRSWRVPDQAVFIPAGFGQKGFYLNISAASEFCGDGISFSKSQTYRAQPKCYTPIALTKARRERSRLAECRAGCKLPMLRTLMSQ
jgi:hypothetical protein